MGFDGLQDKTRHDGANKDRTGMKESSGLDSRPNLQHPVCI